MNKTIQYPFSHQEVISELDRIVEDLSLSIEKNDDGYFNKEQAFEVLCHLSAVLRNLSVSVPENLTAAVVSASSIMRAAQVFAMKKGFAK